VSRVAWRLFALAPTLAGVVIATFLLTRALPGDPAVLLAAHPGADAATIEAIRARLGLDLPLWRQFWIYVQALAGGDLGLSFTTGQPVARDLLARLPASIELMICALALAVAAALPLGIAAALRPGSMVDHVCRVSVVLGASLPSFVTGLLLIYGFYALTGWAPEPIGRIDPFAAPPPVATGSYLIDYAWNGDGAGFLDAARHLALPAATMALFAFAPLARVTRAAMAGVLSADFLRAAKANGLRPRAIIVTYALGNALPPIVTVMGVVISYLLGAGALVEKVFAWPGVGSYAVDALLALDYAPVQGFTLAMAVIFALLNLFIDLIHGALDPRAGFGPDG